MRRICLSVVLALCLSNAFAGDPDTQNAQGLSYYKAKDYSQALIWFTKSANQGHQLAQNSLGIMYSKGQGVTKNYNQAVIWFAKAASQGHQRAQHNIGVIYARSNDSVEADKWFTIASNTGHQKSIKDMGITEKKNDCFRDR